MHLISDSLCKKRFSSLRLMAVIFMAAGLLQVDSTGQAPKFAGSPINAAPSKNPWEPLDDMPRKLGRFVLASGQERIYQLGGIAFNIRRGQRYGHQLTAYDPTEQRWEKLPAVPHGTGGAHMSWWPEQRSLVTIGGIKKLGDRFATHGITVGSFPIAEKRWDTKFVPTPGLGRVAAMIHLDANRFLLIAGDDDLNAHRSAILEMKGVNKEDELPVVTVVGQFPKGGRVVGIASTGQTVSVLQSNGQESAQVLRFNASGGEYIDRVMLSTSCDWTDEFFSWQDNLLIWKNHERSQPPSYQHASQLLLIDEASGQCQTLHPNHPGPIARRSSDGVVFGNAFYVFGGQRDKSVWLKDVHRYQFRLDSENGSSLSSR